MLQRTATEHLSDEDAAATLDCLDGAIRHLRVYVTSYDQSLSLGIAESYSLRVEAPIAIIQAATVYGALHALETFSQLVDRVHVPEGYALPSAGDEGTGQDEEAALAPGGESSARHGGLIGACTGQTRWPGLQRCWLSTPVQTNRPAMTREAWSAGTTATAGPRRCWL